MSLRFEDIAIVLEHVALPADVAGRLQRARVQLEMSDEELAALNDACIAYVQERGFDACGGTTDVARRLERIVDVLNED